MKRPYKITLFVVAAILLLVAAFMGYGLYLMAEDDSYVEPIQEPISLQNGDIIFQTSLFSQSKAIQLATHSKYSHVGIIFGEENSWYVYEAVQPVKKTPLQKWIARGEEEHYVIKRLKNSTIVLTPAVLKTMKETSEKYKGKDYDLYFEWSDDKIYCSELVWKIYKDATGIEVGKLQKLTEFDLSSPEVKKKMKERYGNSIPENETVISPGAMFDSEELITIIEK